MDLRLYSLKKVIIDDPRECLRIDYNLDELRKLASTLQYYLELNISWQWMAEGSDALAPIAWLTELRDLRIRDYAMELLKI
jgi:hypothetical protein